MQGLLLEGPQARGVTEFTMLKYFPRAHSSELSALLCFIRRVAHYMVLIVLSTNQPLFVDKYLLNCTTTREIGVKPIFRVNIFCRYGKSSYICNPNTEMVLWPSG